MKAVVIKHTSGLEAYILTSIFYSSSQNMSIETFKKDGLLLGDMKRLLPLFLRSRCPDPRKFSLVVFKSLVSRYHKVAIQRPLVPLPFCLIQKMKSSIKAPWFRLISGAREHKKSGRGPLFLFWVVLQQLRKNILFGYRAIQNTLKPGDGNTIQRILFPGYDRGDLFQSFTSLF